MSSSLNPDFFPHIRYVKETPVGRMYIHILEQNGEPWKVFVRVGKMGSEVSAMCEALAQLVTRMIQMAKTPLDGLIFAVEDLSNIGADRGVTALNGMRCRSGAEAVYQVLSDYQKDLVKRKYGENVYRPASFRPRRAS